MGPDEYRSKYASKAGSAATAPCWALRPRRRAADEPADRAPRPPYAPLPRAPRPRPPAHRASHDPSFPSDHATGACSLAFAIWLCDGTIGTVLLVLAALLSFARVYVGTHYPGDVLGG